MESVWEKDRNFKNFNSLEKDINTDILIIGGGIAGLLCAYMLHRQGADYVLVEKGEICSGVTGNTTAKITAQHGLIYTDLLRRFGKNYAKLYKTLQHTNTPGYNKNLTHKEIEDFYGTPEPCYSL